MNFKKLAIILFSTLFIISGCGKKAETPVNTASPTPSATASATATPDATSSPDATSVPDATSTPDATATPDATSAPDATATPHATSTPSATLAPAATPNKTPSPNTPAPATPAPVSVNDKMNSILQGVETPRYEVMPIDAESFESFFFVPYVDGAKAVSADALISSTAHSVCLVSLPNGTDAQSFASKVKQNADPRKWICVEAESVQVAAKGNMVLLVMSDSKTANAIINNFNK